MDELCFSLMSPLAEIGTACVNGLLAIWRQPPPNTHPPFLPMMMNPHMFLMLPMKAGRAAASHFPVAAASFMYVIKKRKSWARLYTQFARWLLLPKLNEPPVSVMGSELQPRCFPLSTSEKKQHTKNCQAHGGKFDLCTPSSDLQMQHLFRMKCVLCNHVLS